MKRPCNRSSFLYLCILLCVQLLLCSCATTPEPPYGSVIKKDRYAAIQKIAVLGGRTSSGKCLTGTVILKAFPSQFEECQRFTAVSYRDVLMGAEEPFVDLDLPFPKWHKSMDKIRAREIGSKLGVDGILVVWTVKERQYSNNFYVMAQLFCSRSGIAVACMETSKALRDKKLSEGKPLIGTQLTTVSRCSTSTQGNAQQYFEYNRSSALKTRTSEIVSAMLGATKRTKTNSSVNRIMSELSRK